MLVVACLDRSHQTKKRKPKRSQQQTPNQRDQRLSYLFLTRMRRGKPGPWAPTPLMWRRRRVSKSTMSTTRSNNNPWRRMRQGTQR
ncbi:hypothetical protein HaLaN_24816 [Haematococcus lacustris]|uniref:Uncharacterized protein n=1 Tax=Haematococcus lacustris TaxID=44745 RepID=A0A6A0A3T2_HAELA|nr:hypothetical protein HaLaN_24816 [Haematococcus lacustris]